MIPMASHHQSRRRFLRGLGGSVLALPLLESFAEPGKKNSPPMRMVAGGVFYGLVPQHFHPKEVGKNYQAPRLLQPMERHREHYTVFSGLDHNLGGAHTATKYFLSGIPIPQAPGFTEGNISVDQKAANHVGSQTRFPSLVLDCESGSNNHISWTKNASQVRPVTQIEQLYSLLFSDKTGEALAMEEGNLASRQSVLDLVRDQASTFKKKIGKADLEKLDQYFTSVRELEKKIDQSKLWLDRPKPKTDYQLALGVDALPFSEKTPLFYDLMALALQTDSTRVITLSFMELGPNSGGLPGVDTGYHTLSHHGQVPAVIEELSIIEDHHLKHFARFLDKLREIKEPNGKSLLDHTMALFGCGMSNANSHSNRDLPVLLAGGGFDHGQHRHYAREKGKSVPLCNLYLTMLQRFGLELDRFNTSSGTLSEIESA